MNIIGQKKAIEQVEIIVRAKKRLGQNLEHLLLVGPPGVGKTTIAKHIGSLFGKKVYVLNGALIKKPKDIINVLVQVDEGCIIFVDEIHNVSGQVQEFLLPILESFTLNTSEGNLDLAKFTLIGATTSYGHLKKPLLDRFAHKIVLSLYSDDEIFEIVQERLNEVGCTLDKPLILAITKRARGTPRIALNYTDWIHSYSLSHKINNENDLDRAFELIGIDHNGLTEDDRKYLAKLEFGPCSLSTLISATNLTEETILNIIEPYLVRMNLIKINKKGRELCNEHANTK